MSNTFYDLKSTTGKGETFDFATLKGKVVLIVNVASKCGFTKQYKELEDLYQQYHEQGFEIIGFPCNQFGGQEPGDDESIASFCSLTYGVDFPIMKKTEVNGDNTDPVYKWLKSQKSGFLGFSGIKWNFEKFLISKDGQVINRWSSLTPPLSLKQHIESALAKKGTTTANSDAAKSDDAPAPN